MNLLLKEIAGQVPQGRHAVVLIDNAGWHVTDKVQVAAQSDAGELAAIQPGAERHRAGLAYLRDRYLSGCLLTNAAAIVDACYDAWNRLLAEKGRIRSLADRPWTYPVSP